MKKYKIVNNKFFKAGYYFSDLSQYYRHVIEQLKYYADGIKKSGQELEEAYREKGRDFDKEFEEKFQAVFADIWPGYFHNSFLITVCSRFENEVKDLCEIIREEHSVEKAWYEMKGPAPAKTKQFLKLAKIKLQDDQPQIFLSPPDFKPTKVYAEDRVIISNLWHEIDYYYRVRNCIVHDNGLVERSRGAYKLQLYAQKKNILNVRKGQPEIQLTREFNETACDVMHKFFEKLMSAYYSAPLPE